MADPIFYDAAAPTDRNFARLPHWGLAGAVAFMTFRTADSMPREVLDAWLAERDRWLAGRGYNPSAGPLADFVGRLPPGERHQLRRLLADRWEFALDRGAGSCPLRDSARRAIVADSLRHADGRGYHLFDFVVMPNHVHVLASFGGLEAMRRQCTSWKHFTAARLNKLLGRAGRFWESDNFDHLVRSAGQFDRFRRYIASNPRAAGLSPGEATHYSAE